MANDYTFELLKVNSVDFTSYVVQKSYSVQKQDEYAKWTDGNWIEHREVTRQRISGSFSMTFTTETEFDTFKSALNAVKTNGYYPIQVYVNTTKTLESINAFLEFSVIHKWTTAAFGQTPEIAAVDIKVTQR